MFKKLREKITEEVQQTSLRLPVSVQQSVQQLTQTPATDQWLESIKDGNQLSLSPFSGTGSSPGEQKRDLPPSSLQDELLVDISDIRPAGHNKDLFSIDEDSHEGSPSKSGFQLVDLSDAEAMAPGDPGAVVGGPPGVQGVAGVTFDPTMTIASPRTRRDSAGSSVSDASGLFPIYEVPGVSFSMPQSDLESSSEWEDGGGGVGATAVERLSKDTVYQAYLKMRSRYHKYKGRYSDLARAYKEKEKESEKLRDVLTKTQDKALRKVSELKEQCSLEQQAKAHLEQELRSDLEERDHKITALQTKVSGLREQCVLQQQAKAHLEEELTADLEEKELKISALLTKVKILQEGVEGDTNSNNTLAATAAPYNNNNSTEQPLKTAANNNNIEQPVSMTTNSSNNTEQPSAATTTIVVTDDPYSTPHSDNSADNVSTGGECGSSGGSTTGDNSSMGDSVSVASHGSTSTAPLTASHEAEELIDKLRATVETEERDDSRDVAKHKSLLARCMENIRGNKERIATLTQERDLATTQLQEKIRQIEILKEEHVKELDSLRSSVESSALSMAETKKQLFEELQVKEAETERWRGESTALEQQLEQERTSWQDQLQSTLQVLQEKEVLLQELMGSGTSQEEAKETSAEGNEEEEEEEEEMETAQEKGEEEMEDQKISMAAIRKEVEMKMNQLEARTLELKESRTQLEGQLAEMGRAKMQLEKENEELNKEMELVRKELEGARRDKDEARKETEEVKKDREEVRKEGEELKKDKEEMRKELETVQKDKEKANENVEEMRRELEDVKNEREETKKESEEIQRCRVESVKERKETAAKLTEINKVREELEGKCKNLEDHLNELHKEKKDLEEQLAKTEENRQETEKRLQESIEIQNQLHEKLEESKKEKQNLEKQIDESVERQKQLEINLGEKASEKQSLERQMEELRQTYASNSDQAKVLSQEIMLLKEANSTLTHNLKVSQKEKGKLRLTIERVEREKEEALQKLTEKSNSIDELQSKCAEYEGKLKSNVDEIHKVNEELKHVLTEKDSLSLQLEKVKKENMALNTSIQSLDTDKEEINREKATLTQKLHNVDADREELCKEKMALTEKLKGLYNEKEEITKEVCMLKEEKESNNAQLAFMEKEIESLKSEKEKLNSELTSSREKAKKMNEEAFSEISSVTEKMNELNSNWAAQMKEKDRLNEELCKKVSEMDSNLKIKAEEYSKKVESLKGKLKEKEHREKEQTARIDNLCSQLQEKDSKEKNNEAQTAKLNTMLKEKEDREKELEEQKNIITEENLQLNKILTETKRELETKETEYNRIKIEMESSEAETNRIKNEIEIREAECNRLKIEMETKEAENDKVKNEVEKENHDLRTKISELEADLNTREAELTSAVEERTKLTSLCDNLGTEKARLAEELKAALSEVSVLKEKLSLTENDAKEKEVRLVKLAEEASEVEKEHHKTKEEMSELSETFKAEMTKAKTSYTKLKESFQTMKLEKEVSLTDHTKKMAEMEDREAENCRQVTELQSALSLKEVKIVKLLEEKKLMLGELENKMEELQQALEEKENLLRTNTMKLESKIEEMESQMSSKELSMMERLENSLQETHRLEGKVAELSHSVLEKEELLVRQTEEAEQKLMETQEEFAKEVKELENTWEQRLRCELDRLQKQHEEKLASSSEEVTRSEQSQCEAAGDSYQRAVATRDATIAALKDEADRVCLEHEEEVTVWRDKYHHLESKLAAAQLQDKCEGDWLQVIESSMEQSSIDTLEAGPQVDSGSGPGPRPQLSMEERLRAAHTTCKALTAKIDHLVQLNQQLQQNVEDHKKDKDATAKTVAMLEFNNEHNKNKVHNMELSRLDLNKKINALVKEKERLIRQLREGSSSGLYEELTKEKEEMVQRITLEKDELERKLIRDRNALEDRLMQEKEELEERNQKESAALKEKLDSLTEVRQGYEKQIEQIEASNTEMHNKIGVVQLERDTARTETRELLAQKSEIGKKLEEITQARESMEQQIIAQRGVIATLEEKLNTKEGEIQGMTEATSTLQNNILNLQKQVEGLNETCSKLARDLEAESKLRIDTQSQLAQARQAQKQNQDIGTTSNEDEVDPRRQEVEKIQGTGTTISSVEVERQRRDYEVTVAELSEVRLKCANLQAQVTQLEENKRTLVEKLTRQVTGSPSDTTGVVGIEHAAEATLTNSQQRNTDEDSAATFRVLLTEKQEELSEAKQTLLDVQERLRVAEVVSGEVEEQRARVKAAEAKLVDAEKKYQIRLMEVEAEAEKRIADTQQLCHQTISSAYDKQDTETSELVRQQQQVLKEAQARAKEKASQLESVVTDYETKLKYEDQLAALRQQHEVQVKEVEAAWQARAEKMARQRETQKQEEMDGLTQEWNKERRELERLTQVAAAAFRSGTESVELLKKQVASQRRELEEVKLNHAKEIGELKALLELKRRSRSGGGGAGGGGVRLGVSLEEAAEFEYLKNILYQYMLGKETQTLSKVLCAVVKFDSQQQREIMDHEEQRHSLVSMWPAGRKRRSSSLSHPVEAVKSNVLGSGEAKGRVRGESGSEGGKGIGLIGMKTFPPCVFPEPDVMQ